MDIQLMKLNKDSFRHITALYKNDPVFSLAFVLALASCIFAAPKLEYINFEVLACLFNLMVVVKAFEELRLLDKFAVDIINTCTESRKVSLVMILLSFFSAMLVTNDIALMTLVPLTIIISKKSDMNILSTVILQTLAANIGSSLTPVGNPQNLYIFSYYRLTAVQFFTPVLLFAFTGLVWLYALNLKSPCIKLDFSLEPIRIKNTGKTAVWSVMFGIIILSVFGAVSYRLVFMLTLILAFALNRELLKKVDYFLLATFVCFFIFIGNISSIPAIAELIKSCLDGAGYTYFTSILLSQVVSNVPCTILLSQFTSNWRELLLGANVGGMGTIIASLASVISYKLYTVEYRESSGTYLKAFSVYNFISLALFAAVNYFFVIRYIS